jgi:hypothetical protein
MRRKHVVAAMRWSPLMRAAIDAGRLERTAGDAAVEHVAVAAGMRHPHIGMS